MSSDIFFLQSRQKRTFFDHLNYLKEYQFYEEGKRRNITLHLVEKELRNERRIQKDGKLSNV